MPYKDKDKQREAAKGRMKRYRARKGVTSPVTPDESVTPHVTPKRQSVTPCVTPNVTPVCEDVTPNVTPSVTPICDKCQSLRLRIVELETQIARMKKDAYVPPVGNSKQGHFVGYDKKFCPQHRSSLIAGQCTR